VKLAVFSHKEVWRDPRHGSAYVTVGGFPAQMKAISELFDETEILCALHDGDPPPGHQRLEGHRMTIHPRPAPQGRGHMRKLLLPLWLVKNGGFFWRLARRMDAVHAVLLGDVGTIGLLVALAQRKPLFARHCGMWTYSETVAARVTKSLLVRCAGGPRVVMATGGGEQPPEPLNHSIEWIFATSLTDTDLQRMPVADIWNPGQRLRLVSVGRLSRGKNFDSCIRALPAIRLEVPGATMTLVGDGEERRNLEMLAGKLGVADSVEFLGNQPRERVFEALGASHVFVFPSAGEGFPKAVLEAMACGLPVIASGVSVLPHLLGNGGGIVLDGTDSKNVARSVIKLTEDPELMGAISRTARARASEYTLETWRDVIGERLEAAWGCRLKSGSGGDSIRTGAPG